MLLANSSLLLALTWITWWVASLGLGWILLRHRTPNVGVLGWCGLFVLTIVSLVLGLIWPLGSPVARSVAWLLLVIGLVAFAWARLWRRWRLLLVIALIAILAALLSSVVPSNYDLGLYHAGSIAYVRDGGTVIGLANLHDRFGFSSSMWPLSAFLGLGLWNGGEFRLVNGLLTLMLSSDIAVRLSKRSWTSPSTIVLAVGGVLLVGALVIYPGRLLASSAQDWAAAVLIVVSTAYLLEVLGGSRSQAVISVSLLTAAMAGAMRPTGWIFALVTLAVVVVTARSRSWRLAARCVWPGLVGAATLGIATAIRDALTSGWILFPSGFLPLPVSWRYPDAVGTSLGITAWARTPFQDSAQTMADTSWITGWLARLPTDWAVFSLLVLGTALVVVLLAAPAARRALTAQRRTVFLALAPSIAVLVAWLVVAPDPRFAWGPVLLIVLVPLSFVASAIAEDRHLRIALTLGVIGVAAVVFLRGSPSDVSWWLQPLPEARLAQSTLSDGTEVVIPLDSDQCWAEFPLCRPGYSDREVELRGENWREGFQPMSRLSDSHE